MKQIYIGSDNHFFHKNILKFQQEERPFNSIDEMNNEIIKRHNEVVNENDIYFHLGDFAFTSIKNVHELLNKMNGKKHFILGNHDRQLRDNSIINRPDVAFVRQYFELNLKQYGYKDISPIVLFHYPISEWNRKRHGAYHLHGHEHCSGSNINLRFDVGIDGNNLYPHNLLYLINHFENQTQD